MAKLYAIKRIRNRIVEYFQGGQILGPNHKRLQWGNNPFSAEMFPTRNEAESVRFRFDTGGRVICLGDPACLRSEP